MSNVRYKYKHTHAHISFLFMGSYRERQGEGEMYERRGRKEKVVLRGLGEREVDKNGKAQEELSREVKQQRRASNSAAQNSPSW